jgi:AhpD family alkylhydroperoxidase
MTRKARIQHPVALFPEVMKAMQSMHASAASADLPAKTLELCHLRASQINGCSVCADMHGKGAKKLGETDERLFTVAAWRDTPYFTDAERAALELTEHMTRMADKDDPVPDRVWDEAARHFNERQLAALVVQISAINVWNRFNVSIRQVVGAMW